MTTTILKSKKKLLTRQRWLRVKNHKILYLMVLPALIAYILFSYAPLYGWGMAFINYRVGKKFSQCEFVGLKYFIEFFKDTANANRIFVNTLSINILSIIFIFACSIIFAIMLSELHLKRFTRGVQMVSLFPFFLSWIIAYSMTYSMFGLETGAINQLLMKLGFISEGINVLGEPNTAWPLMIFLNVWKNIGYYSIIFLSTIVSIPTEEYEAAAIDGANRMQKVHFITLPHLKQVFFIMLILQCGSILGSNLEQFMAFTNSQNYDKMIVFSMYVYKYGLGRGQFSYAVAVGIINTFVSLILVWVTNKLSKKFADSSVF